MQTTEAELPRPAALPSCPTLRLLYCGDDGVVNEPGRALHPGEMTLGREVREAQGICLAADRRVSRVHASIRTDAGGRKVRLLDGGSKNGSFVNGHRVQERDLHDGDVIRVGSSLLLLRDEPAKQVDAAVPNLRGSAPAIRAVRDALSQAATSGCNVLILGESGTGKEVAAQSLHQLRGRKGPLVAVNCAAIPAELAESQLFGHLPGAFTGAHSAHDGYFRSADRGTIFLDEVGELPLTLQAKLLRVLEDKKVCPVGGTRAIPVDAWLLAATNRDLLESVSQGRFRADLYARLAQVILQLPPLRERREDILLLLVHLLELPTARLTVALAEALLLHPFPFNVRELIQLAAQLRLAARGGTELDLPMVEERLAANAHVITRSAVRVSDKNPPANSEHDVAQSGEHQAAARLPAPSREELVRLLQEHKGHISRVALAVGRSRRQVDRWLELHGLLRKDFLD